MSDSTQRRAKRLREARIQAGFGSASDAAAKLAVPYGTYISHENGSRAFEIDIALYYAKRFNVRFEWLAIGRGTSTAEFTLPTSLELTLLELDDGSRRTLLKAFEAFVRSLLSDV